MIKGGMNMNCLIPAIRNVSSILLLGIIASCSSGSDDVESGESNLNPLLYVSRFREDSLIISRLGSLLQRAIL